MRNTLLEARDDVLFTIGLGTAASAVVSGRWGNRTLSNPVKGNWLAPSFLSQFGYLPFRQWSHRESKCGLPVCRTGVFPLDHGPAVDRRGVEPRLPGCKPSVLPLDEQPIYFKRSVRESNPVPLLTTEVCCRNTYRPFWTLAH